MPETEKDKKKPPLDEAAGIEKTDITLAWVGKSVYLNPDPVLKTQGGSLRMEIYERVLRDPHVFSGYQTRFLAVTGKERQILPGTADTPRAKRAAELAEQIINAIPLFDQTLMGLLYGIHYGFRMAEIMWEYSEGDVWIRKIICRRSRFFVFNKDGDPRLLTIGSPVEGEELPPYKFQRFVYPGGDDNPYGEGLAQRLYWWEWFKRNNVKFWVLFNEKFGSPTAVGKYPPGASADQKDKLLEVLQAIQQESGITIPENQEIDLLEAARRSTTNTYHEFCAYCDAQASKCIVGQTLTTEVGDKGSYAAGKVHKEVKDEIVKADADLLCYYFNNETLRWAIDFNMPGLRRDEYPQVWIRTEGKEDLNNRINRDERIAKLIPVPVSYIRETYDIPEPQEGEEIAGPPPQANAPGMLPGTFAEAGQENAMALQESYAKRGAQAYKGLMDAITSGIGEK